MEFVPNKSIHGKKEQRHNNTAILKHIYLDKKFHLEEIFTFK